MKKKFGVININRYTYSSSTWHEILKDFESLVEAKRYDKMDYKMWRHLNKIYRKIDIYEDSHGFSVQPFPFAKDDLICYFDWNDGRFGSFWRSMRTNYFFDEDEIEIDTVLPNITSGLTVEFKNNEYIKINKKEENNTMMKFNFDFGPVDGSKVHMSMYGIAVKNAAGTWVSWDTNSKQVMDVDILNMDCARFIYKMPVALKDVVEGDVVIHNRKPMFVEKVNKDGFWVVDVIDGEKKNILPTKSPFNFDFIVKVVNLFGNMNFGNTTANAENPFGNMLPLMLMGDNMNKDNMLPLMLMMNQGKAQFNPMMMFLMMDKDRDNSDMLPLMLMMNPNMLNNPAPTAE